jgi:hypothetical protein
MERVDSKVDALKKDFLLRLEITAPEREKYADTKLGPVTSELSSLKSDLFSTKVEFNSRLKALEAKSGMAQKKTSETALSIILMIAGIFITLFGAYQIIGQAASKSELFLYAIAIIIGIVFVIDGFQKYPKKAKEFKPVGLDYVK